jgi:hypothetical protein
MSKKIYRADFIQETAIQDIVTGEVARHNGGAWESEPADIYRRINTAIQVAPMLTTGLSVILDTDPPQIRVLLNGNIAVQITQCEEL